VGEWSLVQKLEGRQELWEPVEDLLHRAKSSWKDAAIAAWVNQVRVVADEALMTVKMIMEVKSLDYTLEEIEDELRMASKRGQQLGEFLASAILAGFSEHPKFEEIKRVILEQVMSVMEEAEDWLTNIKKAYLARTQLAKGGRLGRGRPRKWQTEEVVEVPPVPIRKEPAPVPPTKAPLQPSEE
jgi:hypothetical protein